MKDKLYILIVGLVMVALALGLNGKVFTGKMASDPSINVTGTGKVYVVPDVAYIYIGVRSQADQVSDALQQNNAQAAQVSSTLKELGIEEKDIQTTAFNVYPQQEYSPEGLLVRTYYTVENTVYVTVRDLAKLGSVLDSVVRSGANSINGISFDVQDRTAAEKQARELAIANARERANEIATSAGVKLGDLINVSVYSSGTPVAMYEGKGGQMAYDSSVPVAAGQMVITADANLIYAIK